MPNPVSAPSGRRWFARPLFLVLLLAGTLLALAIIGPGQIPSEKPMLAGPWGLRPNVALGDDSPFAQRTQKAPPFPDHLPWVNTGGPIEMKQLRGKFVVLDFWTYCCINCMHILPELKKLEHAYPNELVVVGVHSAKFDTEKDAENITEAVQRYEIEHPVVVDSEHEIWNSYGVNSWPTLLVIDPEGYAVHAWRGEVRFEQLDEFFKRVLPYYQRRGLIDATPLRFELAAQHAPQTPLRYPGKVLADETGGRLFIADSNHNRIVVTSLDGSLQDVIGSGASGQADGDYATASFNKPQGMALSGQTLYVADTENHLLRKIDLAKKHVQTIAGTGRQADSAWPGVPGRWLGRPRTTGLNSPWALWIHDSHLYIAMAGPHQIWWMPLDESGIGPYAGNGREDIVDGPLLPKKPYEEHYASFAQPSGLTSDGKVLYVADSEGSSIRVVPFDPHGRVTTLIGTSHLPYARLFTFGDEDGTGAQVRFQHCLGVTWYRDRLYVADTYNNKIKVVDVQTASAETLAGNGKPAEFDEPAGLSAAAGKLYIADTNNHQIRTIDLEHDNHVATLEIKGLAPPKKPDIPAVAKELPGTKHIAVDAAMLKPQDGKLPLAVTLKLPEGYKVNPDAPMSYTLAPVGELAGIDTSGWEKSVKISPPQATFEAPLRVTTPNGEGRVRLTLRYFYCAEGSEGLCKMGAAAWEVPLRWSADAPQTSLPLEVTAE